jgi:hypothetical protein
MAIAINAPTASFHGKALGVSGLVTGAEGA